MDPYQFVELLKQRISQSLVQSGEVSGDLRRAMNQVIDSTMAELGILSQQEFDAQSSSLHKAETKVQELEKSLARLEHRLEELETKQKDT